MKLSNICLLFVVTKPTFGDEQRHYFRGNPKGSRSEIDLDRGTKKSDKSPSQKCPKLYEKGVFNLPWNVAYVNVDEYKNDGQSLTITSFFNVAHNSGPTAVTPYYPLHRDLVARIHNIQEFELENNLEVLTDLTSDDISGPPPKTVWPNDAARAPDGVFPFEAVIIPQGFLTAFAPGRLTAINVETKVEYIISQSTKNPTTGFTGNFLDPTNMPRFYHRASFMDVDMDGLMDIVTVRSGFQIGAKFYPPAGELVWFKNPGDGLLPDKPWVKKFSTVAN
jgi:hypothetical protein